MTKGTSSIFNYSSFVHHRSKITGVQSLHTVPMRKSEREPCEDLDRCLITATLSLSPPIPRPSIKKVGNVRAFGQLAVSPINESRTATSYDPLSFHALNPFVERDGCFEQQWRSVPAQPYLKPVLHLGETLVRPQPGPTPESSESFCLIIGLPGSRSLQFHDRASLSIAANKRLPGLR